MNARSPLTAVLVSAALVGTSASLALGTGAAALVLSDMHASRSIEARIILGAAVVDDVLGLIVLGIVSATSASGRGGSASGDVSLVALVMKAAGFLVLAIVLGSRVTPAWFRSAARLQTRGAFATPATVAVALVLTAAAVAAELICGEVALVPTTLLTPPALKATL